MNIRGEQAQACDDDPASKNDKKSKNFPSIPNQSRINLGRPQASKDIKRHQKTLKNIFPDIEDGRVF